MLSLLVSGEMQLKCGRLFKKGLVSLAIGCMPKFSLYVSVKRNQPVVYVRVVSQLLEMV
jgi:hypothetical protein